MTLRRIGRLALARQARGDAESGEPDLSGRAVQQNVGRLDVLMDEAALVQLADSHGDADGQAQEASRPPSARRAAGPAARRRDPRAPAWYDRIAHDLKRPHRPCSVQLIF